MFRTIFNKYSGEIIVCQKLNETQLQQKLAENADWDYINLYTKGVYDVRVNPATKKLQKVDPAPEDVPLQIRSKRKRLLDNSDWTQAADSPLSDAKKAEWAAYRQALRDLPDEQGSASTGAEVIWPTPP
jgi:Phage tail assembly chaperone protein